MLRPARSYFISALLSFSTCACMPSARPVLPLSKKVLLFPVLPVMLLSLCEMYSYARASAYARCASARVHKHSQLASVLRVCERT
eukprot:4257052-Pleurochrysis_carterae.AAC.1